MCRQQCSLLCLAFIIGLVKCFARVRTHTHTHTKEKQNPFNCYSIKPFSSTLVSRFTTWLFYFEQIIPAPLSILQPRVPSMQTPLHVSSALQQPHHNAKRAGFVSESLRNCEEQKDRRWVNWWGGRLATAERATRWSWRFLRGFAFQETSHPTQSWALEAPAQSEEALIRKGPYELLIVIAPLPQPSAPFKIQIPFKSNRLCWVLSCGSLSAAAPQEKGSNGCSRKRNQLEAPRCPLPTHYYPMIL